MKHPARYNKSFLPIFAGLLKGSKSVLDPMAGTGERLKELSLLLPDTNFYGIEIEPEWANMTPEIVKVGNILKLPFENESVSNILVSPPYGNRMADHHNAKDGSRRTTYRHMLNRPLSEESSAGMHWGARYREFHIRAWIECYRVAEEGLVLNVKNHIRGGKEIDVVKWHIDTLIDIGFKFITMQNILCKGNRFGANSERVNHEHILTFIKE